MGRSRGFTATLVQIQREGGRQRRQQEMATRRAATEADKARRAYERAAALEEKERKRLYLESRIAEVALLNDNLAADIHQLSTLLSDSLAVDDFLDIDSLKEADPLPAWDPGDLAKPAPVPEIADFEPPSPTGLARFLPGAMKRHEAALQEAKSNHATAMTEYAQSEIQREERLAAAQGAHQTELRRIEDRRRKQHSEIEEFKAAFRSGQPQAVIDYFALVLEASQYPNGFPQAFRLAYIPESRQLAIQYQLPSFDRIPVLSEYRYVRTGDKITEKARPIKERQALYKDVIARVTVRTIHEIFEADRDGLVDVIAFNGHVDIINTATGREENPCLVTVMVGREPFMKRNLSHVDALACLLDLSASVSKSPAELISVRPVLDFNMVDPRFVEEADVLSGLDQRPNLMELSASDFESLITNLFTRMGLEARQTQASRDGGVDCVAFDSRPIFGGKVIIQAKRYKNTVGVSAVRDLFGSVHNEGASKGILVTTSGYGKAAYEFAKNKPLELLTGSNLLYLLKVHADVDAKIEPPEHWVEPPKDSDNPHWHDPEQAEH